MHAILYYILVPTLWSLIPMTILALVLRQIKYSILEDEPFKTEIFSKSNADSNAILEFKQ